MCEGTLMYCNRKLVQLKKKTRQRNRKSKAKTKSEINDNKNRCATVREIKKKPEIQYAYTHIY